MVAALGGLLLSTAAQYGLNTLQNYTNAKIQSGFNQEAMALQNAYNVAMLERQYDKTQQGYRESPLNMRKGYEAAGVNPIFALGNGVSFNSLGLPTSNALGVSGSDSNFGTNAYQNKIQRELSKGQLGLLDSEINYNWNKSTLTAQQVNTEIEKQENLKQDTAIKRIDEELKNKELSWYDKRQLTELRSMIIGAQAQSGMASAAQTSSNAQMIGAKATEAYKHIDIDWMKKHPYLFNVNKALGGSGLGSFIPKFK